MNIITRWLDGVTMYRLVLYVLLGYVGYAAVLSFTSYIFFSVGDMAALLGVLLVSGTVTHYLCAWLFRAPANIESTLITMLILFLLYTPTTDTKTLLTMAALASAAVLGKYILAWRKLHIANPVAVTAVLFSVMSLAYATWWVGSMAMLPPVLIGGILITTKIRRWELVVTTVVSALAMYVAVAWWRDNLSLDLLRMFFVSWPIIFFATVMVTEPLATPAGKRAQIIYGLLIGSLSSFPIHIGPLYTTPELALLIGNLLLYPTTLRGRLVLTLKQVTEIARDTYEYRFSSSVPFLFKPGQYLEWTLPHRDRDSRGIRRYFTIASSPTEDDVILGLKIPENHSRFKGELEKMQSGDVLYATSLDGDFVLPDNLGKQPLVFIAGGIGITPFRSMVKYMIDRNLKAEVTLFNCNNSQEDIPWTELWQEAQEHLDMKVVDVLNKPQKEWAGEIGYISREMLERYIAKIQEPRYYISGPPVVVSAYKKLLFDCGVSRNNIVTDFFPGLA